MPDQARPAPLLRRAAAAVIDLLVIGAVTTAAAGVLLIGIVALAVMGRSSGHDLTGAFALLALAVGALVGLVAPVYAVRCWSRGATAGMHALGLRLVTLQGSEPGIRRAIARGTVLVVSIGVLSAVLWQIDPWVVALLVTLGVAILRRDRRSVHDLIAGTFMIWESQ
ncbi:MAG: RDD family protein [Chloroflexota bacterium]|nr:RDD family protein [Chloroflexota bacterium]